MKHTAIYYIYTYIHIFLHIILKVAPAKCIFVALKLKTFSAFCSVKSPPVFFFDTVSNIDYL